MAPSFSFLNFGGCNRNDGYDRLEQFRCALEPGDCRTDTTFVAPNKITATDHYTCDSVSNVRIGRCSDSNLCAKSKYSCQDPSKFLSESLRDRRCSIRKDELTGNATLYTSCLLNNNDNNNGDGRQRSPKKLCVFASDECEANSQESRYHDELCDCSMTRTGACFFDSNFDSSYYCAVSSEVCGSGTTFRTAHELYEDGTRDCRLCEGEAGAFLEEVTTTPSLSSNNASRLAFIITGSIFLVFIIVVGGILLYRRQLRKSREPAAPKKAETSSVTRSSSPKKLEII